LTKMPMLLALLIWKMRETEFRGWFAGLMAWGNC